MAQTYFAMKALMLHERSFEALLPFDTRYRSGFGFRWKGIKSYQMKLSEPRGVVHWPWWHGGWLWILQFSAFCLWVQVVKCAETGCCWCSPAWSCCHNLGTEQIHSWALQTWKQKHKKLHSIQNPNESHRFSKLDFFWLLQSLAVWSSKPVKPQWATVQAVAQVSAIGQFWFCGDPLQCRCICNGCPSPEPEIPWKHGAEPEVLLFSTLLKPLQNL